MSKFYRCLHRMYRKVLVISVKIIWTVMLYSSSYVVLISHNGSIIYPILNECSGQYSVFI